MSGFKDKLKGKTYQVKGEIKEKVGKAMDDRSLQVDGKMDQTKGAIFEKVGEIKDKANDVIDKVEHKIKDLKEEQDD